MGAYFIIALAIAMFCGMIINMAIWSSEIRHWFKVIASLLLFAMVAVLLFGTAMI